jgi:hypothetical protein
VNRVETEQGRCASGGMLSSRVVMMAEHGFWQVGERRDRAKPVMESSCCTGQWRRYCILRTENQETLSTYTRGDSGMGQRLLGRTGRRMKWGRRGCESIRRDRQGVNGRITVFVIRRIPIDEESSANWV